MSALILNKYASTKSCAIKKCVAKSVKKFIQTTIQKVKLNNVKVNFNDKSRNNNDNPLSIQCLKICLGHLLSAITIQRWYRKYRYTNQTDPITLEPVPKKTLFVLVDKVKNHRYKFDRISLYNYFRESITFENPFTREELNRIEVKRLQRLVNCDDPKTITSQRIVGFLPSRRPRGLGDQNLLANIIEHAKFVASLDDKKMSLVQLFDHRVDLKKRKLEQRNLEAALQFQNAQPQRLNRNALFDLFSILSPLHQIPLQRMMGPRQGRDNNGPFSQLQPFIVEFEFSL